MTYCQAKLHQHFYKQTLDQPSRLLSELPWTTLSKWKSNMKIKFFFFFFVHAVHPWWHLPYNFTPEARFIPKKQRQATNSKRDRQTCIQCKQNTDAGWTFFAGDWTQSPATKRNFAVKFASLALIGAACSDTFEKGKPSWCLDVQSAKTMNSPTMIP